MIKSYKGEILGVNKEGNYKDPEVFDYLEVCVYAWNRSQI